MPCLDCLSDEKTLIPAPICQDECDNTPQCEDELDANCITVTPALPCIDTEANTALTIILQAIDAKLCQSVSNLNSCKVKTSANDSCCDYLGNKISVSGGLIKTTVSSNNCETLNIAHPDWNYNDLLITDGRFTKGGDSPYLTLPAPQVGAYYNTNTLTFDHEVKLKGVIVLAQNQLTVGSPSFFTSTVIGNVNNVLKRPATDKFFSGNIIAGQDVYSYNITIRTNGNIELSIVSNISASNRIPVIISFDGINYSI